MSKRLCNGLNEGLLTASMNSQPGKERGKEDINHLSAKYTVISYEHSNVRELNTQESKLVA